MLLDQSKHKDVSYIHGDHTARLAVNDSRYRSLNDLGNDCYELEKYERCIRLRIPVQLGYFILQYAKKRMLEFHYDFLRTFFPSTHTQQLQMDTDSNYIATAAPSFDEMLKNAEMADKYNKAVYGSCGVHPFLPNDIDHWIPRACCEICSQIDEKTPGFFKSEAKATVSVNLCSKTYVCSNQITAKDKFSSKGLNKKAVTDAIVQEGASSLVELYKRVLDTGINGGAVNTGFRIFDNRIKTYAQRRNGLSYFYIKRRVLDDGISTAPLDIILQPVKRTQVE